MSANPIDQNPTPKTTGSLEELFRHHLGEEAAVPTRPVLWDQIDNSLLVKQNDVYRRRLTATRWVAAASLLLASLAGTGWWVGRDAVSNGSDMAAVIAPTATRPVASASTAGTSIAGPNRRAANTTPLTGAPTANATATALARRTAAAAGTDGLAPQQASPPLAARDGAAPAVRYGGRRGYSMGNGATSILATKTTISKTETAQLAAVEYNPANPGATTAVATASGGAELNAGSVNPAVASAPLGSAASVAGTAATVAAGEVAVGSSTTVALAPGASPAAITESAAVTEEAGLLASLPATLTLADVPPLPAGLTAIELPATELAAVPHHWHYSASYAAGVFNPNVNFSRANIESQYDYNRSLAFGANSPVLTESAATEYRNNLRPGFSQRLALLATRHLQGHWSVGTGLEISQATAQSASSAAFVGEQLFDLGQANSAPRPLQRTDFRYRLASVPVEVRYANTAKQGWSFYGRLGGVVSALLGVRSEVDNNPEATRTYSLLSAGSPYRRVLASVRGGAGAQFRTSSGKWALAVGPVADLGLLSLNAHPAQSYFAQSRPYTLGMEAAIEFGR